MHACVRAVFIYAVDPAHILSLDNRVREYVLSCTMIPTRTYRAAQQYNNLVLLVHTYSSRPTTTAIVLLLLLYLPVLMYTVRGTNSNRSSILLCTFLLNDRKYIKSLGGARGAGRELNQPVERISFVLRTRTYRCNSLE